MASLPARQQPQRRSSPEQTTNDQPQAPAQETPVRARSAHSEDSQTLFLNSPRNEDLSEFKPVARGGLKKYIEQPEEPKKCWICFADSTEDTPDTSPWRDPCPCALVAHEDCLLDWIADTESPTNRNRSRGLQAPKIECPQCKSEIKLSRPWNPIVAAVSGLERASAQLVTPGAVTLLVGTLYNESMLFGVHAMYSMFGSTEGVRILRPLLFNIVRAPVEFDGASGKVVARRALKIFLEHMVHWRLYMGVPLIGPILVLSRTTLADSILPVLPVLFFATQMHSPEDVLDVSWPPSASMAFAVLPYVRQAYNAAYRRLFAEREKRWLREIQPRAVQAQEGGDGGGDAGGNGAMEDRDGENMFEVRIDGGIWEEWEEEPQGAAQNAAQPAPPEAPPAQQVGQADPPPNIADNRAAGEPQQQAAPPAPVPENNERRLSFSPTSLATSILGALLFPSLAGMSGEMLKLALPRTWTTPVAAATGWTAFGPKIAPRAGLLQQKWARSLVGGCLFVVLKDAVGLYVKWRMARMHAERRVVDYQGDKGKGRR